MVESVCFLVFHSDRDCERSEFYAAFFGWVSLYISIDDHYHYMAMTKMFFPAHNLHTIFHWYLFVCVCKCFIRYLVVYCCGEIETSPFE